MHFLSGTGSTPELPPLLGIQSGPAVPLPTPLLMSEGLWKELAQGTWSKRETSPETAVAPLCGRSGLLMTRENNHCNTGHSFQQTSIIGKPKILSFPITLRPLLIFYTLFFFLISLLGVIVSSCCRSSLTLRKGRKYYKRPERMFQARMKGPHYCMLNRGWNPPHQNGGF